MKVANLNRELLTLSWMPCRLPARHQPGIPGLAATFFLKAAFQLQADGQAIPWPDGPVQPSGDLPLGKGGVRYPSDFVPYKPHGEWLVVGTAHGPERKGGDFEIRVEAGQLDKRLWIFGERLWQGSGLNERPGPAAIAEPTELSYENAWGGENVALNPIGQGPDTAMLPRIELPGTVVATRDAEIPPAGLAPIPMTWPQRSRHLGTYDEAWLQSRWPWYPDDFDPAYFQSALQSQWLSGYWRGDERLTLHNLIEHTPQFRSQLPGLKGRCFVERAPVSAKALPELEEVPLNLDTLWVDLDTRQLVLVWRGRCATATPKFHDLLKLLVLLEPIDAEPRSKAAYAALLEEALNPKPAPAQAPPPENSPAEVVALSIARAEKRMHDHRLKAYQALEKSAKDQHALSGQIESAGAIVAAKEAAGLKPPPGPSVSVGDLDAHFQQMLTDQGLKPPDGTGLASLMRSTPGVEEAKAADARLASLRQEAAAFSQRLNPRVPLKADFLKPDGKLDIAKMEAEGVAEVDLSGVDFSGLSLLGIDFRGARLVGANFDGAFLLGSDFTGADLSGANLSRAILSRANFAEADLTGCKLQGTQWKMAMLPGAILASLDLSGVDFTGIVAPQADFTKCRLTGANFQRAQLAASTFAEAVVEQADFRLATLTFADFRRVKGAKAIFDDAKLTNFRGGEGADFTGASFKRVQAEESVWEGALLPKSEWEEADLPSAKFCDVQGAGSCFDRCDLTGGVFEDANLQQTNFRQANLLRAIFDRADLTESKLDEANLFEAGLWETNITRATWFGAMTKSTRLHLA